MTRRRSATGLLLLLLVLPATAVADYKEEYRAGIEAVERGDWSQALARMDAAIEERPDASGLLGGPLLRRYTPHYYRGLALARLGRCREAIEAFDESERQGRITKSDEYQVLQIEQSSCRELVSDVDRRAVDVEAVIEDAATLASTVAQLSRTPVLAGSWTTGDPSFEERRQNALGALAEARRILEEGRSRTDLTTVSRAGELADEARESLASVKADAEILLSERREEAQEILASLDDLAAAARRDVRFVERTLDTLPPLLVDLSQRVERVANRADDASVNTPMDELSALRAELARALQELRRAFRAPPDPLLEAASAYFSGDYGRTIEILDSGPLPEEARVAAHACAFRAASLFSLGEIAGDDELLARARRTAADCAEVAGEHLPAFPRGYFPPSFETLWEDARRPPGEEPTELEPD